VPGRRRHRELIHPVGPLSQTLSVFTLVIPDGATSRSASSDDSYSSSPESRSISLGSGTESSFRRRGRKCIHLKMTLTSNLRVTRIRHSQNSGGGPLLACATLESLGEMQRLIYSLSAQNFHIAASESQGAERVATLAGAQSWSSPEPQSALANGLATGNECGAQSFSLWAQPFALLHIRANGNGKAGGIGHETTDFRQALFSRDCFAARFFFAALTRRTSSRCFGRFLASRALPLDPPRQFPI
jgi:hypothetical protein